MILRGKSVQPLETHGGLIMLQELRPSDVGMPIIMQLKVGNESHVIRFTITNEA